MKTINPAVVEFTNDAFYLAFNNRDLSEMERLWAEDSPVVCIHPGWQPLTDRDEILLSWERIFANQAETDNPSLTCYTLKIMTQGDLYSVLCYEQLGDGWLIATNNYLVESGELKLVHHQAGQCMDPPELEASSPVLQ